MIQIVVADPDRPFQGADVVRFVTASNGLCGPVSRTNRGQMIKKA